MFTTTELSSRVLLTVLSLGATVWAGDRDDRSYQSIPLTYADDYRNPFDSYGSPGSRHSQPRPGLSTVVSSGSYSISPGKAGAGSSLLINARPIPYNMKAQKKGDYGQKAAGNAFDCFFGKNCPTESPVEDWRTYYSVLNGLDKPFSSPLGPNSFNHKYGLSRPNDPFSSSSSSAEYSSLPFTVTAPAGHDNRRRLNGQHSRYPDTIRRSRTTTPSSSDPSWVKLEPVPAKVYDPFAISAANSSKNESSKFANRVGVELSPESFADRHGWNEGKVGTGGSRLPSWLEELNIQHGGMNKRPTYDYSGQPTSPGDRDDDRWVKLDAIPVTGVSISKWVPKGTSPSELPSTNWPEKGKPSAWWDRIDTGYGSEEPYRNPSYGNPGDSGSAWPSRYPPERPHKHHHHSHPPSDGWGDVIYPDNNPVSATQSWDGGKAHGSWPNSYNKNKQAVGNRYPVASWSASGSSKSPSYDYGGPHRQHNSPYPYERRPSSGGKPPFYPDPNGHKNDPRWVLVSSSKGGPQEGAPPKPNINYDPDFPYAYYNNRNRQAKDMNLTNILATAGKAPTTNPSLSQDELFRRTNATLHTLTPVLGSSSSAGTAGTAGSQSSPTLSQALVDIIATSGANYVAGSTEKYFGDGKRTFGSQPGNKTEKRKGSLGRMNPIYAAVGAGMIPATLAAVLPMAIGRRKRHVLENSNIPQLHASSNPASVLNVDVPVERRSRAAGFRASGSREKESPTPSKRVRSSPQSTLI